jgi:hypothetical protein
MTVVFYHDSYFVQHRDACGHMGPLMIQKCIATLQMLAYGVAANAIYEYCHLPKTISTKCLKHFVKMICVIFECEYLWQPLRANLEKQLRINGDYDFVGMFVLLDCMHYYRWKNCPIAW